MLPILKRNLTFKKEGRCFICGDLGHHSTTCRHRHKMTEENPPKDNLVEGKDIIIVVIVYQVNMIVGNNEWVVDFGVTKHICGDKSVLYHYELMREREEQVFMGSLRHAPVLGKDKYFSKVRKSFH